MWSKKKKTWWIVSLRDGQGANVFEDALERLSFQEDCVIALSIEFYDDPSPCEIHRSAVILRAIEEIKLACQAPEYIEIETLSDRIKRLLGAYPQARSIRVMKQEAS